MALPNFIIIGAAKSGTTSLYHYIGQHPELYMSPDKEPRYFAFKGDKSGRYAYTELDQYEGLFNGVGSEVAIGEASTYYMYSEVAAGNIKELLPAVKLIAVLRNPIDRAYSQYTYWLREGREREPNFEKVIDSEIEDIAKGRPGKYLDRGLYGIQLERYYRRFPSDQIRVYTFEELCNEPARLVKDVFGFLGIDDSFETDLSRTYNVTTAPSSGVKHYLYRLLKQQERINVLLSRALPTGIYRGWVIPLARRVTGSLRSNDVSSIPEMDAAARERLREWYREDILLTEQLTGCDLSAWLM